MAGRDSIEIEQGGRTLAGSGVLRVTRGVQGRGGWSTLPTVDGLVTFDARVTSRELEAMDSAEVRVTLGSGARHTFRQAVVMEHEPDPRVPNAYALSIDCYEVAD